jgi:hypothetical protein
MPGCAAQQQGGKSKRVVYNGHSYVVRTSPKGAKYIVVKGEKKYLSK